MKILKATLVLACIFSLTFCLASPSFASNAIDATEIVSSDSAELHCVLPLTREEIDTAFESFLDSHTSVLSEHEVYSQETLDAFIEYAVSEGLIEDNAEQRAALSVETLRSQFAVVVSAGRAIGCDTAADLLEKSLQDVPGNFVKASTTGYAIQIYISEECQDLIRDFKEYVVDTNLSSRTTSGSITLNSTSDLFLAYNKVDYVLSGTKSNGKWNLTIKFTDVYDFDRIEWRDGVAGYSDAVAIINNYAVRAQEEGAIVPFNIMVTVRASFAV